MFYEPIYAYTLNPNPKQKLLIEKTFTEKTGLPKNLSNTFNYIKFASSKCAPIPKQLEKIQLKAQIKGDSDKIDVERLRQKARSNIIQFKNNIGLNDLIYLLERIGYIPREQVVDYNSHVIGVFVIKKDETFKDEKIKDKIVKLYYQQAVFIIFKEE